MEIHFPDSLGLLYSASTYFTSVIILCYLELGVQHLKAAAPVVGLYLTIKNDLLPGLKYLAEI